MLRGLGQDTFPLWAMQRFGGASGTRMQVSSLQVLCSFYYSAEALQASGITPSHLSFPFDVFLISS